jgi:ClpP class serine protease
MHYNPSFFDFFWLLLILLSFSPWMKQRMLEAARLKMMKKIEEKRKSRVITMIHRQEGFSFLGIPFMKYINIEDSERILRAVRLTPDDMPIDLIIHTPGGLVLAAEQIATALVRHKGKVTVIVPHFAMSGGTFIALAADEIIMDPNAVLGPVDPQLGGFPAASIVKAVKEKPLDKVDDKTLIMADVSEKALQQVRKKVAQILTEKGMEQDKAERIAQELSQGKWTHDYPLFKEDLEALGLNVSTEMPSEVYALMDLYEQPAQARPSVQYIPVPYKESGKEANTGSGS